MEFPKNSDAEVLMREINQIENTLADLYKAGLCEHLIDPTVQVSERVQHLADMMLLAAKVIRSTQAQLNARQADRTLDSFEQEN